MNISDHTRAMRDAITAGDPVRAGHFAATLAVRVALHRHVPAPVTLPEPAWRAR